MICENGRNMKEETFALLYLYCLDRERKKKFLSLLNLIDDAGTKSVPFFLRTVSEVLWILLQKTPVVLQDRWNITIKKLFILKKKIENILYLTMKL